MPPSHSPAASTAASASLDAAARPTNVRWRIFLLMLLLVAINYIDRASLSVAMPLIAPEFNLSPALEGLMLSAFFWSYALMQIPVGAMLDRYHTRGIIATATLAWGAFQALGAASHNWILLMLTRMGLGFSESPVFPAGAKLMLIAIPLLAAAFSGYAKREAILHEPIAPDAKAPEDNVEH